MKISNARIGILTVIGAAAISMILALGALAIFQMRTIKATAIRITGDTMPSIYLSGQLQSVTLLRYTLLTDYVDQRSAQGRAELVSEIENANTRIDATMDRYESLIDVPADTQLFEKLKSTRKPYDECYRRVLDLSRDGNREAALSLIETQLIPLRNAFLKAAEAEVVWNKADADDSANGITRALNWVTTLFTVGLGLVLGIAGIVLSIRRQLRIERTLRETEDRFQKVFEFAPVGVCITAPDGSFLQVNETFCKMLGYSAEELLAKDWADLCHPDDLPAAIERQERLQTGQVATASGERRYLCRDGSLIWSEVNISLLRAENGTLLSFVVYVVDITGRKKAEQERQFQHSLIHAIYEGSPDGIIVLNQNGEIASHNKRFFQVWAISATEIVGTVQAPRIGSPVNSLLQSALDVVKDPEDFLLRLQTLYTDPDTNDNSEIEMKDGRTLERYSTSLRNDDGKFLARVLFYRDITERKQAEQALQSSEEKFRQLAENIAEVFWMMNPEGTEILYVGSAYEQIWGRSCESLYKSPMDWMQAIRPEDRTQAHDTFMRQLLGESIDSEYRISTPDGQQRWIRDRAFPVRDQAGELIRIVGIAEEITERKRYEEELILARETAEAANRTLAAQHATLDNERKILRAFIDNVPDFMYVKDIESRFVIANHAVVRWAGAEKPEDLVGKTDFDFCSRELAAKFFVDEQRVIRTCEPMYDREETSSIDATREVHYSLTTKVPLFDRAGLVKGIAGIGRDITARKKAENELLDSNRQLQQAMERANRLATEAESANQAKSEFLANMSHEIRTPMNGVLGMIGLLLCSDLEGEQRHYAQVVEDSAKSLLTLIDDILDFSKVEAGKLELEIVDFNLHLLMGEFADAMAERVREKPVEFVYAVAPGICASLQGDPGRLRQVLMNLVGNATKFTRQGEVVLRADLTSETDTAVCLRFSVRDTGIGIPRDKQQKLFTSFNQVDASTTRKFGGTGLGLAISKKLVELMGGEIGMESEEGVGSEFWFTLTLGKQLDCRQVESPKVPVKGTRILVVDDNATNREVLTEQMQSWGAVVVAVESGSTALSCLRYAVAAGRPFHLAVLDMMMPGIDGATLGGAILADKALKSTPLVMMTSLGQRGDALRSKEIGFAAYLVKPVRPSDLLDCLMTVLTGEQKKEKRALITRHSLEDSRRSNARILLVEDNRTNQEVAIGMLRRMGWHADIAADGKQALQALQENSYDLVLMDVQMPELDGYDATRAIRDPRSLVLNHDIPIIATTAHAMQGDIEKCLAAGMSDYVAKPIEPAILSKMVEKWLKRKVHSAASEDAVESIAESEAPPAASPVFKRETFLQRMMGDDEFAHEVAAEFVKELPALLIALKQQVELGAIEPIWKQAHRIKGSAANVSGEALREVASEIEQAGKAGDLARAVSLIPELEIQAARLSEALRDWASESQRSVNTDELLHDLS